MAKILVLAEKPSVGKEIGRVLKCSGGKNGYMEGEKYVVTWALGHLVTLADPEHYGDQYKQWSIETLPMLPEKMDLVVIPQTGKQFRVVKELMKRKDIDSLVIATDAGREGELVARWIVEKVGFKKPMKRLWISSQTDKAILQGFSNLKPSKEYDGLYQSAVCRAKADWLVGLNITRALTCKYNAQLSAGRVQTPTLAMIVQREQEIQQFKPVEYFQVLAVCEKFSLLWKDKDNNARIFNSVSADQLIKKISGQDGIVHTIENKEKNQLPPLLYDLTELQRDGNRLFGFSAKQTLALLQKLYEQHKLVTYPRTDSRYLTSDLANTLKERLQNISIGQYKQYTASILAKPIQVSSRIINDSKVSDHHGIIPTEERVNLMMLSNDEKKIYDLIVKRFIAVFYPPCKSVQRNISCNIGQERFTVTGKVIVELGWRQLYQGLHVEEEDDTPMVDLPNVKIGDRLHISAVKKESYFTKPPARYTEATLLSAMEHPDKFITDKVMKNHLNEANGLGTPATRAEIIEKLFSTFYVERRNNTIHLLSKGKQLIDLVPEQLKSPLLTAQWEEKLNKMSKGKLSQSEFMEEITSYTQALIGEIIHSNMTYNHDNMTKRPCPECGKYLLEVTGKKGKMLVCQDRQCGHRQTVSQISNARCPECKKKLDIVGENDKKLYRCQCGFREKFERFNDKLKENKQKVSKKELQNYMKQQKTVDAGFNQAFAEALKKAQEKAQQN